jgi:catechol 2,3-dioxygenase-like lactoylglutathione lyase family enzyme
MQEEITNYIVTPTCVVEREDTMVPIHGLHHIGMTVPDMDEATRFFETMFGAVTVLRVDGVDVDDEFMKRRLGVPAGRRIEQQRVIVCGAGGNIELFEYSGEGGASLIKRNSEVGACHLAFQVDDAHAAAARLRAEGVDVLEGPTLIDSGPMKGLTWVYLRSPWGQFLEIVSADGPLGYESAGGPSMWSPIPPA